MERSSKGRALRTLAELRDGFAELSKEGRLWHLILGVRANIHAALFYPRSDTEARHPLDPGKGPLILSGLQVLPDSTCLHHYVGGDRATYEQFMALAGRAGRCLEGKPPEARALPRGAKPEDIEKYRDHLIEIGLNPREYLHAGLWLLTVHRWAWKKVEGSPLAADVRILSWNGACLHQASNVPDRSNRVRAYRDRIAAGLCRDEWERGEADPFVSELNLDAARASADAIDLILDSLARIKASGSKVAMGVGNAAGVSDSEKTARDEPEGDPAEGAAIAREALPRLKAVLAQLENNPDDFYAASALDGLAGEIGKALDRWIVRSRGGDPGSSVGIAFNALWRLNDALATRDPAKIGPAADALDGALRLLLEPSGESQGDRPNVVPRLAGGATNPEWRRPIRGLTPDARRTLAGWLRTRKRLGLYEVGAFLEELDKLERFDSDWHREQARIRFRLLDGIPGWDRVFRRYFDLATFSGAGRPSPEFIRGLIDELIHRGESPDRIRCTPLAEAMDRLDSAREISKGRSDGVPRQDSELAQEDRLESELRRTGKGKPTQAALVAYMRGKESAIASDVGHKVHGDRDALDKTIRGNLKRINEFAEGLGSSLRYRLKGGRVWKEGG